MIGRVSEPFPEVSMARFNVVLSGYDTRQVDSFVARIEGTLGRAPLEGAPVTVEDFEKIGFDVRLRAYDRHEVERTLREYRRELEAATA
jgi:DivIVA domain-containing protein